MLAGPLRVTSLTLLVFSLLVYFFLLVYFSRNVMIFSSLALLRVSGMVLFSSAAPVTHYVNVSNDTAPSL